MNGTLLQERIYAGYAKAAAHVGQPYSIYRAATPISPLEAGNLIGEVNCFFAADQKFSSVHKFKEPTRYMWADGRELQQLDILVGPYGTFFVGDMQPNLPMQAVRCNDSIQVNRPIYQTNPIAVVDGELIVFACPCFRQLKKVDQKPVNSAYGASTAATPIGEWFVYAPIDWTLLKQNDLVTDESGRRYTISTVDPTEIGAVIVIRQADTESEG